MAKVLYDFQAMARNELAVKKGDLVTIRKLINQQWMEVEDCSSGLVVNIHLIFLTLYFYFNPSLYFVLFFKSGICTTYLSGH